MFLDRLIPIVNVLLVVIIFENQIYSISVTILVFGSHYYKSHISIVYWKASNIVLKTLKNLQYNKYQKSLDKLALTPVSKKMCLLIFTIQSFRSFPHLRQFLILSISSWCSKDSPRNYWWVVIFFLLFLILIDNKNIL